MKRWLGFGLMIIALFALALPAMAAPPSTPLSGAIWTTTVDGTIVNLNQYPSKEDVYLNGGPGINAPAGAAALPDGTYVYQVTDPSGKTLLSTDAARCRLLVIAGGVTTAVVDTDCEHATGLDADHDIVTVQLYPFNDTPNPGGEYKAWITPLADYLAGCRALLPNGSSLTDAQILALVDCGEQGGNRHGFINSRSKTDNFKVNGDSVREIDVEFFKDSNNDGHYQSSETLLSGLKVGWTDTLGVKNVKYSGQQFTYGIRAFIEVPEVTSASSTHYITIQDQKGCKVGLVHLNDFDVQLDSQGRLAVDVTGNYDYLVQVACSNRR